MTGTTVTLVTFLHLTADYVFIQFKHAVILYINTVYIISTSPFGHAGNVENVEPTLLKVWQVWWFEPLATLVTCGKCHLEWWVAQRDVYYLKIGKIIKWHLTLYQSGGMLLMKDISKLSAKQGNFLDSILGTSWYFQLPEKLQMALCIIYGQCKPKYKCWSWIDQCNGSKYRFKYSLSQHSYAWLVEWPLGHLLGIV